MLEGDEDADEDRWLTITLPKRRAPRDADGNERVEWWAGFARDEYVTGGAEGPRSTVGTVRANSDAADDERPDPVDPPLP